MKSIVVALIALSGSFAFAGGALDAAQYDYSDAKNVPAATCVEGSKKTFTEAVAGLDRYVNVVRTCVNGSFYPKHTTVGRPCKEGAVAFWSVGTGVNDNQVTTRFVCTNGKYVQAN